MLRKLLASALIVTAAGAAAAEPARVRPLLPPGGMWQGIPHAAAREAKPPATKARSELKRKVAKAAKAAPAAGPKARPPRHPVAAAAAPAPPAAPGPAARARELSRRIGILAPGATLDAPIFDRDNPPWRRTRPGSAGPDGRALALPLDETGRSGFVARGYRKEPSWNNPTGNTGATFGLRTKF